MVAALVLSEPAIAHPQVWAVQRDWFDRLVFPLLLCAYLIAGLVGHDAWKQDEAYIVGIVQQMLQSHDWLVPVMDGEPFMEKPPLFYWLACGLAAACASFLPLPDGARLATGVFMAITCYATAWLGRVAWGGCHGRYAVMLLLCAPGMVVSSHLMMTDIALLAGFAIASCGVELALRQPWSAGLLLGTGVGIGFLAKGLLAPAVWGTVGVLLPILFPAWRRRIYLRTLAMATVVALPLLLVWPVALYTRSPLLFDDWFWLNNVGRFVGFSVAQLGAAHPAGFWLRTLPWFAFPVLPLALTTIWLRGGAVSESPTMQWGIVLCGVLLAVLGTSASARASYALPLLLPLALIAAPGLALVPPWLAVPADWASRLLFGGLAAFLWLVWLWYVIVGQPPDWPFLTSRMPLDFHLPPEPVAVAWAAGATVLVMIGCRRLRHLPSRALSCWAGGVALCWALVATLWLPWIDAGKSYRGVFLQMRVAMPPAPHCVASMGLGESERAMLRYFLGLSTQRLELGPAPSCEILLVEGRAGQVPRDVDNARWQQFWEGARPADDSERFWLYRVRKPTDDAVGNRSQGGRVERPTRSAK